ncbi:outer membrane protein assembly factor BamB family protein [Parapedobacter koreensis]|uniref:Quinoprotein glucose dehydrogenase n=1 Tax=Parapedobacter koreensis TaxID=332977 RepID=A0A1H7SBX5_9SPHI|nr:PQQ-binding-like beta-propeller repeat protein [Parapedobacter koreensis]SEL69858.1 quinoprotein glucose dehydrogenase [Parapedobacter koreensis]
MRRLVLPYGLVVVLAGIAAACAPPIEKRNDRTGADWPAYGGNNGGNRYSPLIQIDTGNVHRLEVAWTYHTGENADPAERGYEIQCQPIIVDGILYGTTPQLKAFAVKADTGEELWKFDPFSDMDPRYHVNRGVAYWRKGDDQRIFYTAGPFLFALDARTGQLIPDFGDGGKVSLYVGLDNNLDHDISNLMVTASTPGIVYQDVLIMGSRVSEFGDAAPGHVRAFDVHTGALRWMFHTIPQPGEYGYDTWPEDAYKYMGGANNWSGMTLDSKRGVVYLGTGSPSTDFYGGGRHGQNLFGNCILALDALTGARKWHFQTIHHDLWDRDIPNPPNLIQVRHQGKLIDAVAQATKDGLIYVLDRDTGEPLFPVEERPVPLEGAVPGEAPWPTQPYPVKPAPFARQYFTEADINDLDSVSYHHVRKRFLETRSGNKFIPPSIEGTLVFHIGGGAEWGGTAADPEGVFYVNSNEMPWDLRMMDLQTSLREERQRQVSWGETLYLTHCAACHGADGKGSGAAYPSLVAIENRMERHEIGTLLLTGKGMMPAFKHISERQRAAIVSFLLKSEKPDDPHNDRPDSGQEERQQDSGNFPYVAPYVNNGQVQFRTPDGYPGVKPPWGTLNAVDLNTGEYLWQVPLGEFPELKAKGIPPTGTENHGGPIVTAGGLLFIGATQDELFRAFDKRTGEVLWAYQLPAGGFATPATYEVSGRQYVVIAAGGTKYGRKSGGSYIAFALPE